MSWIVGVDEAGYGPNLGPFVMSAVACRVPDELADADLWHVLSTGARRNTGLADDRLLIDDSKEVYSTAQGLEALERGVWAALFPEEFGATASLEQCLGWACPTTLDQLRGECWFSGQTALPVAATTETCRAGADSFRQACNQAGVTWGLVRGHVVAAPRFNHLLEQWGSKGAILGQALTALLGCAIGTDDEPVAFFIDKHGGRNFYAAMLQQALPDGMVVAVEEGRERSVYRVLGMERDIRFTFQPRADAAHLCVALASMLSKYLREVLMLEFNRFWQNEVPGLKPTAGYPNDAARFFAAIRPAAERLGIQDRALWRSK